MLESAAIEVTRDSACHCPLLSCPMLLFEEVKEDGSSSSSVASVASETEEAEANSAAAAVVATI